ncbi:threonine/serine ThrE exporter family protein [Formosa sp. S-31]|uniref:threonine/serine ThrE exporter family protein n=1 Tax=Formosa sp. S-31 TaxID=2790949 RepID=UPI003EB96C5B
MNTPNNTSISKATDCLLKVGALLMGAGASTNRIKLTLDRYAEALGYECELLVTHRTVFILVRDLEHQTQLNSFTKTPPHGANFYLVSGISKLGWRLTQEQLSIEDINTKLETLQHKPRYTLFTTITLVSLADAAFCRLFGAEYFDMLIAFVATALAFLVKHYATSLRFNPYLTVSFASFTACLITGAAIHFGIGTHPELAFNTAVLFLIPGIPLINSFTDLIEGFTSNGIVRGTHAMLIAFSIALGMIATMYLYNF